MNCRTLTRTAGILLCHDPNHHNLHSHPPGPTA